MVFVESELPDESPCGLLPLVVLGVDVECVTVDLAVSVGCSGSLAGFVAGPRMEVLSPLEVGSAVSAHGFGDTV